MQPIVVVKKQNNLDQNQNQIDDDNKVSDGAVRHVVVGNNQNSFQLGINSSTGRLQWCPGNKMRRLLLVIPATMLPVLVIFLLITHLAYVTAQGGEARRHYQDQYYTNDAGDYYSMRNEIGSPVPSSSNSNHNTERCSIVSTGLAEIFDQEERELLRDVRTSFIPSDLIFIPPTCSKDEVDDENMNTKSDDISDAIMRYHNDDNELLHWKIIEFFRRKRHALQFNQTTDDADNSEPKMNDKIQRNANSNDDDPDENSNDDDDDSDDTAEPNVPWKTFNPKVGNAEVDDTELVAENKQTADPANPVVFHAFWKNEGTPDKIRSAQAEVMKRYMDTSVKPCDDFYQYACGNWEKLNPIPKDKAAYDTFEMLRESLDTVIQNLLTETEPSEPKLKAALGPNPNSNTTNANNTEVCKKELNEKSIEIKDVPNALDKVTRLVNLERIIRKRSAFNQIIRAHSMRRKRQAREATLIATSASLNANKTSVSAPKTAAQSSTPPSSPSSKSKPSASPSSVEDKDAGNAELKAKNLYKSCMDFGGLQSRGIKPILDLLTTFGGWPVLNATWDKEDFDWLELVARLRLYNNDIFIVEWVGPDIKNSDENIIQFDQTSLGLPTRDYFLQKTNKKYLDAYRCFMKTVIQLLGANEENANTTAHEIVDFEIKLANITSCPEERTNVSVLYNRMSIEILHQIIPQIDWRRYLTIVLERPINSTETVVIFAINYMQELVNLLSHTEPKTIANYALWRFVRHRVNNLDDRFQDAKQKFYYILFGREQSPPRWKNCVSQVNSNMGMAVGAMFVRKYFDENSKKDTLTMTNELQQSFRELLNLTDWIDSPTKHLAELKVNAMSLRIGYPDYILNQKDLNEKYKDLNIDPSKYFENTLNVLRHLTRTEQMKLGQVVNKTTWHTAPAVVNAYYSRNKNQIMFPAGILQPPFYHRHFPKSLNYGGIGVVIGHELTHGFDDKGRLFDRDGNLHRWWSDSAIEGFHERARCLVHQYSNYTVSEVGIAVDGENTQGENIADNGGIKQAFRAYKKWLQKQTDPKVLENEKLKELNATSTQLFFLNFAQVWCGAMRPEATKNKLKTAVHSPGKFRVIGTLSNSEDFAREFNCPSGSSMNPSHKCVVW